MARAPYMVNTGKEMPVGSPLHNRMVTSLNTGDTKIIVFDCLDKETFQHRCEEYPGLPPFDAVWLEYVSADPLCQPRDNYTVPAAFAVHLASARGKSGMTRGVCSVFTCDGTVRVMLGQIVCSWDEVGVLDVDKSAIALRSDLSAQVSETSRVHFQHAMSQVLVDVCYAFSMMGCGNVSIIDGGFSDDGLTRRQREERGRGHIAYKVLKVKVGKDREYVLGRGSSGESLDLPLHAVRGHFKTYTSDRPLFGHYVGRYWWPAHARGKAENGEIRKSYEVVVESPIATAPPTAAPTPNTHTPAGPSASPAPR